jgi:hypothetical protein
LTVFKLTLLRNIHPILVTFDVSKLLKSKVVILVFENIAKKRIKGIYNHEKALKSWEHVAEVGAKQYIKEFCAKDDKWYEIFNKTTRAEAAKEIQKYYEQLIQEAVNKKEGK